MIPSAVRRQSLNRGLPLPLLIGAAVAVVVVLFCAYVAVTMDHPVATQEVSADVPVKL